MAATARTSTFPPVFGNLTQMFCYSVRKQVAAMIAALDGIDLVVFTGGIGENDEEVRAAICRGLAWIDISLDKDGNAFANNPDNDSASRCRVRVLEGVMHLGLVLRRV